MNTVVTSHEDHAARRRSTLAARLAEGLGAWPDLGVDPGDLLGDLDRSVPSGPGWHAELLALRMEDLCLALACARGAPAALAVFEHAVLARVPKFLAGMRADDELVAATRQALREKLFVGTAVSPPKIGQYLGRGSLMSWVRVAAVRAALNLREAGGRVVAQACEVDEGLPTGLDVELDYLRSRYQVDVAAALREAVLGLAADDRLLLRLRFADGLTPGQIAGLRGVHRTTIGRRLDGLTAQLSGALREILHQRMRMASGDCDSLLRLLRSQVHLTLGGLLRGDAA